MWHLPTLRRSGATADLRCLQNIRFRTTVKWRPRKHRRIEGIRKGRAQEHAKDVCEPRELVESFALGNLLAEFIEIKFLEPGDERVWWLFHGSRIEELLPLIKAEGIAGGVKRKRDVGDNRETACRAFMRRG